MAIQKNTIPARFTGNFMPWIAECANGETIYCDTRESARSAMWENRVTYINWNGETMDEIDRAQFDSDSAYRRECKRLIDEFATAGMGGAYLSSRRMKD